MKTTSSRIIYDPLNYSFNILEVGGGLSQKKDTITGAYYPDRSITPLLLRPILSIDDPHNIIAPGDHTSDIIDSRWYIGSVNEANRITATTAGYSILENGELLVSSNIAPDAPKSLYFSWAYLDTRRQEIIRKTELITLSSVAVTELNLSLEVDTPPVLNISPFKSMTTRVINASFRNGDQAVPDNQAVYKWMVLDGAGFRLINADDLFYVDGQGTKALTIDRRYVDKESLRLEVSHVANPDNVLSKNIRAVRFYGQWSEDIAITRGRFRRPDTTEIEVSASVSSSAGLIVNPTAYFDIELFFKMSGFEFNSIGYGDKVIMPASSAGSDSTKEAVFGVQVRQLSALRPLTLNGKALSINNKVLVLQVPV